MNLKFLYTDDKTGKFSDTTLRTWIVFGLFILYALVLCAIHILVISGIFATNVSAEILNSALSLFDVLGFAAFGGGFLYLSKRVNERKAGLFNSPKTTDESSPEGIS